MTKPDPNVPDPETPDPETPDPAGDHTPGRDDAGAGGPGVPGAGVPGAAVPGVTPPTDSQADEPPARAPQDASAAAQSEAQSDAQSDEDYDAIWLDLVARLEGVGTDGDQAAGSGPAGSAGGGPAGARDSAGGASPAWTFRDFDPLGLAGTAPIELSARERLSPASGKPAAAGGNELPDTTAGPRDYEPDDDDGAFVPEEPPSLAGADPMTVLAWIGAVGGPIALVLSAMFWRSAPLVAILGMVAAFAASVVFLIMKLPGEKDEHDDGARI